MNNISKETAKQRRKVRKKRWFKKYGKSETDGSSASKEMAGKAFILMWRKKHELRKDPYTTHPMSYEEFDSIPDIGDLINNDKEKGK